MSQEFSEREIEEREKSDEDADLEHFAMAGLADEGLVGEHDERVCCAKSGALRRHEHTRGEEEEEMMELR